MTRLKHWAGAAMVAAMLLTGPAIAAGVPVGDDGLHKPDWLKDSFKILRDDLDEASAADRNLMVIIEQRGCIYCARMHEEVFTDPRVEKLIREKFDVVQIDLFGSTDVTDLDGDVLSEKQMAAKWGIAMTPTMIFPRREAPADQPAPRSALAVVPGALGVDQTIALLQWIDLGGAASGRDLANVLSQVEKSE